MTYHLYAPSCDPAQRECVALLAHYLSTLLVVHADTKWHFSVVPRPLGIRAGAEADAFVVRVREYLRETAGIDASESRGATYEQNRLEAMMVWMTKSDQLLSKLSLVHYDRQIYAFVSGSTDSPDGHQHLWLEAIDHALARRLDAGSSHPWTAVLGAHDRNGGSIVLLPYPLKLGPFTVSRPEFIYRESCFTASLHLDRVKRWAPILVQGSAIGHNSRAAHATAHAQLHLLCCLLSVLTDSHWILRDAPRLADWGNITLPEKTPTLERSDIDASDSVRNETVDAAEFEKLLERCEADNALQVPLFSYYESLALIEQHPSFALVGFVGTIEEIGKQLFKQEQTQNCPTCSRPRTNSAAARFKRALSIVLPEEKVKKVSERLYKWRSSTAHTGRTFDYETTFGHPDMSESMLVTNDKSMFRVRGYTHAQEIARDLLLHLLRLER